VIVGAFVIAAIVTPPDVVSQIMLAVPMWLLYEFGLIVARFVIRPAGASDWKAPSDAEMERELDKADADRQNTK
jgi:sec-independent protein translocase protein TatC